MSAHLQVLNRRQFTQNMLAGVSASLFAGYQAPNLLSGIKDSPKKPNILFVIVDDLRPEMGCYGNPDIKSPHFDSFARQSMIFTNTIIIQFLCHGLPGKSGINGKSRPKAKTVRLPLPLSSCSLF